LDLVDPAVDLAAAICEFALTATETEELLRSYDRERVDGRIRDRLLLYQLLHASSP